MELPPLRTWPALLLTDSELSESCLHSPPLSVRASQWLSTFHFPVRAKRTSVPLHVMWRPEQHTCFYFLSIPEFHGENRVQLCFQISSRNGGHTPSAPLGFQPRERKTFQPSLTNRFPSCLALSLFPFPHGLKKAGFMYLLACQVLFYFTFPTLTFCWDHNMHWGQREKAPFLIIFLLKHSRNIYHLIMNAKTLT